MGELSFLPRNENYKKKYLAAGLGILIQVCSVSVLSFFDNDISTLYSWVVLFWGMAVLILTLNIVVPGILVNYIRFGALLLLAAVIIRIYVDINFQKYQTTPDAIHFYSMISSDNAKRSLFEISSLSVGSLAIKIWSIGGWIVESIGLNLSPSLPIIMNCAVMSLSLSLLFFVSDNLKLDRRVSFFIFSSLFFVIYLFSSLILRGGFVFMASSLVVVGVHCYFFYEKQKSWIFLVGLFSVAAYFAFYLRPPLIFIYTYLVASTILFSLRPGLTYAKVIYFFLSFLLLAFLSFHFSVFENVSQVSGRYHDAYTELGSKSSQMGSLGNALLFQQPILIRIIVGSFTLLSPIPFWANLKMGIEEYHLIRGITSLFFMITFPYFVRGGLGSLREGGVNGRFYLVVASAFLLGLISVSATSLELRHLLQFSPFYLVCVFMSFSRPDFGRKWVFKIWYLSVFFAHLMWLFLVFYR
ncbi:hypothetical protein [Alcanivorax sp. 24]|uniref:hypothetical protein n=1 Tax=Alcanivorax sp. 24 TaxID=2545266 RepID=UPI00105BD2C8|nr:hypothetical protein [Alcanivorax sp. 24]